MNQGGHPQQAQSYENGEEEKTSHTNVEDPPASHQGFLASHWFTAPPLPHTTGAGCSEELEAHLGHPSKTRCVAPESRTCELFRTRAQILTFFLNVNKVTVSKAHCVSKVRQMLMTCKICKLGFNKCCPQTLI